MYDTCSRYFPPSLVSQSIGGTTQIRNEEELIPNLFQKKRLNINKLVNNENLWVQMNFAGSNAILNGAYYKPHELDQPSFEELFNQIQTSGFCETLNFVNLNVYWEHLKHKSV